MQIGTENVSTTQMGYLRRLEHPRSIREICEIFLTLVQDEDILREREQVHPQWVQEYNAHRKLLAESPRSGEIGSFFESLETETAIAQVDPREAKVSFLLGAGSSKPAPSNIPTVKELLPQLLERARRLDREDVTKLADFCEGRNIDNIEDLLTAAQLSTFCSRNPTVLGLMNHLLYRGELEESPNDPYVPRRARVSFGQSAGSRDATADLSSVAFLQDTLQVLFGLLSSTMLPAKPNNAHDAIAEYANEHPGSSIVTTNYDCCMDLALGDVQKDFTYRLGFSNQKAVIPIDDSSTQLIKLHGSLNWFYCETCQEVQLTDIRSMRKNFLEDKAPYPVIGICRDCGGQHRGLLVPPLAMKFDLAPPLTPLLSYAESAFEGADLIVVVGFSFADADVYISRMLSKSMQTSANQRLVLVDPDGRVADKLRRKFKASIPNFDPSRIIAVRGDCAEMLPQFLAGDLLAKEEPVARVPKPRGKARPHPAETKAE